MVKNKSPLFMQEIDKLRKGLPPTADAGIFGASIDAQEAQLLLLSVPWDITCSYGRGSAAAAEALRLASHQLDFADDFFGPAYEMGISLLPDDPLLRQCYLQGDQLVRCLRAQNESASHQKSVGKINADIAAINQLSATVTSQVKQLSKKYLDQGKTVGVIGGEHSAPLGLMQALGKRYADYGVLHIDAHFDLRAGYEGFEQSHASIMYNALTTVPQISHLAQVAIRDYSQAELEFSKDQGKRCRVFFASQLFRRQAEGVAFAKTAREIVAGLPEHVYISFDIDGLDAVLCPSTGTPVAGGLQFYEAVYLIEELVRQKKKVIGFDLCEVVASDDDEWDANVAARILYKLCAAVFQGSL